MQKSYAVFICIVLFMTSKICVNVHCIMLRWCSFNSFTWFWRFSWYSRNQSTALGGLPNRKSRINFAFISLRGNWNWNSAYFYRRNSISNFKAVYSRVIIVCSSTGAVLTMHRVAYNAGNFLESEGRNRVRSVFTKHCKFVVQSYSLTQHSR